MDDFTVAKAIAVAIGVGAILLSIETSMGITSYHVKPLIAGGIVFGGLLFGAGMAILGYCPGTLAISLGEGSLDALFGIIGGLTAGFAYTLSVPFIKQFFGFNFGDISLSSLIGGQGLHIIFSLFLLAGDLLASLFGSTVKRKSKT